MSRVVFKMPDLGEGTVETEIVAWHVKPGDTVTEDQVVAEVMTDKAAVEVPAPVSGRIVSVSGAPGDKVAVGSPFIVFETDAVAAATRSGPAADAPAEGSADGSTEASADASVAARPLAAPGSRVKTSPANRRRAHEAGIDLSAVTGTGPGGRILRADLAALSTPGAAPRLEETTAIKVIGVRRVIAERMSEAKRTIPHFAYVEEVDVTELESLRSHMNLGLPIDVPKLSYLPFVVLALVRALEEFPQCNARYDAAGGAIIRYRAVHVGVATQTPDGLKVPVVRDAGSLPFWDLAAKLRHAAARARSNKAGREELTGSTITVTSLGKLGGIASTPVINAPEVAIVGLNKATERPVVSHGSITVRRIMNLSSSFDHRFVDGYDAAAMIQRLKDYLEHPATIFIPKVIPS